MNRRRLFNTKNLGRLLIVGFPLLFIIVYNVPILWLFMTALKPKLDIYSFPPSFVFLPNLMNFKEVFQETSIPLALANSIKVAGFSTIIGTAVSALAAYGISKLGRAGKATRFLSLVTQMLPPVTLIIPIYLIFNNFSLRDTIIGMVFSYLAFSMPFALFTLVPFYRNLPLEIEEAAALDGCSPVQTLVFVVLPMSLPALAAVAILNFIFAWNEFLFALVLSGHKTVTLPVAITHLISRQGPDMGKLSAGAVLAIIPALFFVFFARRYLVSGMTAGFGK